ncbi:hypothetical protein ACTOVL_05885 [Arcanobacterium canis]
MNELAEILKGAGAVIAGIAALITALKAPPTGTRRRNTNNKLLHGRPREKLGALP